jgi:serralysin
MPALIAHHPHETPLIAGPPAPYEPWEGDGLGTQTLTPWEGAHVAVLTGPTANGGAYDPLIMTRIVEALDASYEVYAQFTGATPTPYITFNGKLSIAELPDNPSYNFAAHGYLGLTGIEIQQTYFDALYRSAQTNQYDQALFYELGRNFWFYQAQLGAADPFVTGFAIANRFISMDVAGLEGGPFNGTVPFDVFKADTLETLNANFFGNPDYTLANTLEADTAPANSFGAGAADFAGSLLYRVFDDFGLSGYTAFYEVLKSLPAANTPAEAVANFIKAASEATGIDYSFLDKPAGTAYLVGSAQADDLAAASGGPVLAYGGNDTVSGSSGADSVFGGGGNDVLHGAGGSDLIVGGGGRDVINGERGADTVHGGDGADRVEGGKADDVVAGDAGRDTVNGNAGDDTVDGGAGRDIVRGGDGDDLLAGGAGADWLSGDRGADTLTGGQGADTFQAGAGKDLITDFSASDGDRIQLDHDLTYKISQVGADVRMDLSKGSPLTLQNVTLTSLADDWVVTS